MILNLKLVTIQEYWNIKTVLQKVTPNWSEEVFLIKKIKNTMLWAYGISDLNSEEIVEMFYEKELQKTN